MAETQPNPVPETPARNPNDPQRPETPQRQDDKDGDQTRRDKR